MTTKAEPRRMGRPPTGRPPRHIVRSFAISEPERELIEAAMERTGKNFTSFVRDAAVLVAKREAAK